MREWNAAGDAVRGHKIGLDSAAIQRQMGIDRPDYGHLTSSMYDAIGLIEARREPNGYRS